MAVARQRVGAGDAVAHARAMPIAASGAPVARGAVARAIQEGAVVGEATIGRVVGFCGLGVRAQGTDTAGATTASDAHWLKNLLESSKHCFARA